MFTPVPGICKCGKPFVKKCNAQKFCHDCQALGYKTKVKIRQVCLFCPTVFYTSKPNKVVCGDRACHRRLKAQTEKTKYIRNKEKSKDPGSSICPHCGVAHDGGSEKWKYCKRHEWLRHLSQYGCY